MGERRVTVGDVAERAGVSRSTVSYVMNDTPGQSIPPATRERVRRAASEIGYQPSSLARALRRGTGDWILLMLPMLDASERLLHFHDALVETVEDHGLSVLHRRVRPGRGVTVLAQELRPAAVLTTRDQVSEAEESQLAAAGIPVVLLPPPGGGETPIRQPNRAAGRLQAEHLVERGHRRLGVLTAADPSLRGFAAPRLDGVRDVCAAQDLPAPRVVEIPVGAAADAALDLLLRAEHPVTGVCAYNDEVAFAVLAALDARGLRAPASLAVVGVDDVRLARFATPPLTTVDLENQQAARRLAGWVVEQIRPGTVVLPATPLVPRLVVRAST